MRLLQHDVTVVYEILFYKEGKQTNQSVITSIQ